jgi:ATP-dependent DNA helicase RecQ
LSLFRRDDERNPFCDSLQGKLTGGQLVALSPGEKSIPDPILQRRYDIIGMKDVYLDFAGRMTASNSVHQHLQRINVGDPVQFKSSGEKLEICDSAGYPVAVLSKRATEKWTAVRGHIENTRVIAMVERRADDSTDPAYKKLLKVDSWEVPVLEVVWDIVNSR